MPTPIPFSPRRKRDFVTDADITAALDRATAQHAGGDTDAAAATLADILRRAIETSGNRHPRLTPIKDAISHLSDS